MKKTLVIFTAITLAILTGCSKVAPEYPAATSGIDFSVAANSLHTKADDSYTGYSISNTFGTFAFVYNTSNWADVTTLSSYIYNKRVRYWDSEYWSTDQEYFWPASGYMHFASYSPYKTLSSYASYTDRTKGVEFKDFTVHTNKDDQVYSTGDDTKIFYDDDLMVSNESDYDCTDMQNDGKPQKTYYYNGVQTLFHHVMSRINIKFIQSAKDLNGDEITLPSGQTVSIIVKKVSLDGIYATGSYSANPGGTETWHDLKKPTSNAIMYDDEIFGTSLNTTEAKTVVSGYFAIPQEMAANQQKITVTYDIVSIIDGYQYREKDLQESAYLTKGGVDWDINKDITYTITLSPIRMPILFTATSEDWTDGATITLTN